MRAHDPRSLVKKAMGDMISRFKPEDEVGLVVFDEDARVVQPLRRLGDEGVKEALLAGLHDVRYSGRLTNIPAAVERAVYELKRGGGTDTKKLIVFVTDGIIDTGSRQEDVSRGRWLRESLLPGCRDSGVRIFSVAFTEEADFGLLQEMAQATIGGYYRALTEGDIAGIAPALDAALMARAAPPPEEAMLPPPARLTVPIPEARTPRYLYPALGTAVTLGALGLVIALLKRRTATAQVGPDQVEAMAADEPIPSEATLHDLQSGSAVKLTRRVTTLGRLPGNDVVIDLDTVSGHHAKIEFRGGDFFIVDLRSTNGTYVNRKRIEGETILRNGDLLRFDRYGFTFEGGLAAGATIIRPGGLGTVVRDASGPDAAPPSGGPLETYLEDGPASGSGEPSGPPCRRHPSVGATERCSRCRTLWCRMCVRMVENQVLCPECP
jgi:hypothetical protein